MTTTPNAVYSQVDGGGQQPPQQGGFFSRLGAGLKQVMPYITPIANRLAAAAGNYGPLELEHQQKELELQQAHQKTQDALAQSQIQNQELNRQLLQKQIGDFQTHEQKAAEAVATKRAESPTTYQTDTGQLGIADTDLTGKTAPRMVTLPPKEVPNAAYAPVPSTKPPVSGPQPAQYNPMLGQTGALPPETVTQPSREVPAVMPRIQGTHYGSPVQDPVTGEWTTPVYQYGQFVGNQPLGGTPASGLATTKSGTTITYKDDGQGHLIPVEIPSSSVTTKGTPPPAKPSIPGGGASPSAPPQNPRASLGSNSRLPILKSPHAEDWEVWTDPSGRQIAGPLTSVPQGAQAAKLPAQEVRDVQNARQAVRLMTKQGDPTRPETQGVLQLIDSLDKEGKLGILASRWNSFMTTGVGAAPGDDPRIVTLINKNMLSDTATMLAHFGASGGRSPQMLQHFLDLANARKMDGPTLKAGILAMNDYMNDRAMLPGGQQGNFGPPATKTFSQWKQGRSK